MIAKFRERFPTGRVSVVADRGMISQEAIRLLTEHDRFPYDYILGCRLRKGKEVGEEVLSRAGRYQEVAPNLKVKKSLVRIVHIVASFLALRLEVDLHLIMKKLEKESVENESDLYLTTISLW